MGNLKKWQTYSSNTSTTTAAWVIHSPTKHLEAARVTFSPTTRSETLVIYKTKQERVAMWRQTKINSHLWLNSPRHHSCLFNMTPQSLIMRPAAARRRCSFHFAQHHTVDLYIIMHSVTRGMRQYSQVECQVAAFHETRYLNLTSHAETQSICVSSSPAAAPCLFTSNTMWCVIKATQGHCCGYWAAGKNKFGKVKEPYYLLLLLLIITSWTNLEKPCPAKRGRCNLPDARCVFTTPRIVENLNTTMKN